MPDDSNGRYSLPSGYAGTTGQTILTSQHNPPLEDIAAALTARLPRNGSAPMLANLPMGNFKVTGMANGSAATDAATVGQVNGVAPIGMIIDFAGLTIPAGWLLCYGQAVSRTTYSLLFDALGTTFGSGDGSTTFNLPDFRGRVAAGRDDMGGTDAGRLSFFGSVAKSLGGILGAASHVLTIAQMPSHNHGGATGAGGSHNHDVEAGNVINSGGTSTGDVRIGFAAKTTTTAPDHAHVINAQGGGSAHPIAQPTFITNKIIRSGV